MQICLLTFIIWMFVCGRWDFCLWCYTCFKIMINMSEWHVYQLFMCHSKLTYGNCTIVSTWHSELWLFVTYNDAYVTQACSNCSHISKISHPLTSVSPLLLLDILVVIFCYTYCKCIVSYKCNKINMKIDCHFHVLTALAPPAMNDRPGLAVGHAICFDVI